MQFIALLALLSFALTSDGLHMKRPHKPDRPVKPWKPVFNDTDLDPLWPESEKPGTPSGGPNAGETPAHGNKNKTKPNNGHHGQGHHGHGHHGHVKPWRPAKPSKPWRPNANKTSDNGDLSPNGGSVDYPWSHGIWLALSPNGGHGNMTWTPGNKGDDDSSSLDHKDDNDNSGEEPDNSGEGPDDTGEEPDKSWEEPEEPIFIADTYLPSHLIHAASQIVKNLHAENGEGSIHVKKRNHMETFCTIQLQQYWFRRKSTTVDEPLAKPSMQGGYFYRYYEWCCSKITGGGGNPTPPTRPTPTYPTNPTNPTGTQPTYTPPTGNPNPKQCGIPNTYRIKRDGNVSVVDRIVGGTETGKNELPWTVAILQKSRDFQFCGGSVISATCIVSAAHCFENKRASEILVALAEHHKNQADSEIKAPVKQILCHSQYNSNTFNNDICILKLATPANLNDARISPVCLPAQGQSVGANQVCTASGWGSIYHKGPSSQVLQKVFVTVASNSKCRQSYRTFVDQNMLCSGGQGKDSCNGDSGGPLTCPNASGAQTLHGIVSHGIDCAQRHPGVYTRVSSYVDWIKNICPDAA